MLIKKYNKNTLKSILLSNTKFHPFPKTCERDQWEKLPEDYRNIWIETGEQCLDFTWPPLPATRFMDFKRNGNRSEFEILHFKRRHALSSLVLAECMEGKGRFLDQIINDIWAICEETFWGVPAHNIVSRHPGAPLPDVNEPVIDLFAGETTGLLSWTHYLLKPQLDEITPLICERMEIEIKRRILDPYLEKNDFRWMGFTAERKVNNWNPWCNSNCLTAFLLMEEDTYRRAQAVQKALKSLQAFIDAYHEDGGCDEGTTYWGRAGGALFDCLELLYWASEGKICFYNEQLVKQIGRYIYRAHIYEDYFINFADGGAKINIEASLVYRYGRRIGEQELINMGIYAYHLQMERGRKSLGGSVPGSLLRKLPEVFLYEELCSKKARPPYVRDVWLDGIQVMAAREKEGDYKGFYLAAKGGNNGESHNHNDVGQFIVYYDGAPLIIDVGVETYTAKTFSSSRYEIWTMQSQYHNLPTVNGVCQKAGKEYRAMDVVYSADDNMADLSMNIAPAYPDNAGIKKWLRRCILHRGKDSSVEISDEFELNYEIGNIMLSLLTPCANTIDNEKGRIFLKLNDEKITVDFDSGAYSCESEYIPITDDKLLYVWGDHLYRIVFRARKFLRSGVWHIIINKE